MGLKEEIQDANEKKFGKKNFDDKYDASKVKASPTPVPPTPSPTGPQASGNINVDLQDAINRRMQRKAGD